MLCPHLVVQKFSANEVMKCASEAVVQGETGRFSSDNLSKMFNRLTAEFFSGVVPF